MLVLPARPEVSGGWENQEKALESGGEKWVFFHIQETKTLLSNEFAAKQDSTGERAAEEVVNSRVMVHGD